MLKPDTVGANRWQAGSKVSLNANAAGNKFVSREIENFTPGSVCLVLASTLYDERDYFRTYEEFVDNV